MKLILVLYLALAPTMAGVFAGLATLFDDAVPQALCLLMMLVWLSMFGYGLFFILPTYLLLRKPDGAGK
jgi:hypothetical protein